MPISGTLMPLDLATIFRYKGYLCESLDAHLSADFGLIKGPPICKMIRPSIVRIELIGAGWVFSVVITNFDQLHMLVEKNLPSRMVVVLVEQWNMRNDVFVMNRTIEAR